jgi:hypothetical protein
MLKRYLDNYYSNALIDQLGSLIHDSYNLDIKALKENKLWKLQIKKRKYNDLQYTTIFEFEESNAISILCAIHDYFKDILDMLDAYIKKE